MSVNTNQAEDIRHQMRLLQQVASQHNLVKSGGSAVQAISAYGSSQEAIKNQANRDLLLKTNPASGNDISSQPTVPTFQDHDTISLDSNSADESPGHIGSESDIMRRQDIYDMEEPAQLEKLEVFAKEFKQKRIKMGFTQGDVGVAMGRLYGTDFSQTTISRFEALNLSFKNMCKLKPMLERWLHDTNAVLMEAKDGRHVILPHIDTQFQSGRKRKKRTSIDQKKRSTLDVIFSRNPKPNSDDLHSIAEECNLDKEVVRVWFCNRRQKEKRIAMHEQQAQNEGSLSSPDSPGQSQSSFSSSASAPYPFQSSFPPVGQDSSLRDPPASKHRLPASMPSQHVTKQAEKSGSHYSGQLLSHSSSEQESNKVKLALAQQVASQSLNPGSSIAFPSRFFIPAASAANAPNVAKAVSAVQRPTPFPVSSSNSAGALISNVSSSGFLPPNASTALPTLPSTYSEKYQLLPPPPVAVPHQFHSTPSMQLVHSNGIAPASQRSSILQHTSASSTT